MRHWSKLLVLLAVGVISFTFSGVAQAELVAYWDFEEGSGATTRDQISMNDDPHGHDLGDRSRQPAAC